MRNSGGPGKPKGPAVTKLPLPNSYWVIPGKLLAGEHPVGVSPVDTRNRLKRLQGVGITRFIDLTMPDEIAAYDLELPDSIDYFRKPIKDHGLPAKRDVMVDIQECLGAAVRAGQPTYVHCRAGIGRTGTVIGCFLVESGMNGKEAVEELNRLWQQCHRATSWPRVPETEEQRQYVRNWTPKGSMAAARMSRRPGPGSAVSRALGAFGIGPSTPAAAERPPAPEKPVVPAKKVSDASDRPPTPSELAATVPEPRLRAAKPSSAEKVPPSAPAADPLFEDETLTAARNLRDRFLGAMVGLAVGDALAAATQYKKPGSFAAVGDLLGGGPFDLPRGAWSDDTSMALCLAESLLEKDGFNPRDQSERYTRWQQQGHLSSTGTCVGITAGTARALAMAKWRRQMFSGSLDPNQLDPEVLSRVGPVVLFFFAQPSEAVMQAGEAARTTCQSLSCVEACKVFAAVLHGALSGKPKASLLPPPVELIDPSTLRSPMVADVVSDPRENLPQSAGNVIEVLRAALDAFRSTDNFRDGALKAVNLGGNSDVVAAVYGQLAGAFYGVGSIPSTWRNSLTEKDLIENTADRLLAQAMVALSG